MKIAISARRGEPSAPVEPRFGRTPWFIVYDTETDRHSALNNQVAASAASGAGIASAQRVIDAGAECVLTGRCGPKATAALNQAAIRIVDGVEGDVSTVVDKFVAGEL